MLRTSSRIHTFVYAVLLSIVLICGSVQLSAYVGANLDLAGSSSLVLLSAIVTAILAPPASLMLALYSHKLIKVQETLKTLAITDPLTKLMNRRAFGEVFVTEAANYKRTSQPLALLRINLDHFAKVNRDHGHDGGDAVLEAIAKALQDSAKAGPDILCRWDGEEFAVLLPNTGRETAVRAALRYRQKIESLETQHGDATIRLTASTGAVICLPDESLEEAMVRADLCLRQAKARGRNKVVSFPAPSPDRTLAATA